MPDLAAQKKQIRAVLPPLVAQFPQTSMQPHAFFVARHGVLALVYRGFSPTLLACKEALDAAQLPIVAEHPGSRWPKTTLAALQNDATLSRDELSALRDCCDQLNASLQTSAAPFPVTHLALVDFVNRSLESRKHTERLPLNATLSRVDDTPPPKHQAFVERILQQFGRAALPTYYDEVVKPGHRIRAYRRPHPGMTFVVDALPAFPHVAAFQQAVEQIMPGRYAWMAPESRHLTLRALLD